MCFFYTHLHFQPTSQHLNKFHTHQTQIIKPWSSSLHSSAWSPSWLEPLPPVLHARCTSRTQRHGILVFTFIDFELVFVGKSGSRYTQCPDYQFLTCCHIGNTEVLSFNDRICNQIGGYVLGGNACLTEKPSSYSYSTGSIVCCKSFISNDKLKVPRPCECRAVNFEVLMNRGGC